MPPEPRAASSRLKRKNAVRENGVIHMAGPAGFPRPTGALPLGCFAPAGESLKTSHWLVFLTGFHLIGSNPLRTKTQQKNRPKAVLLPNMWLGQQDSNLHNWYQKPGSCHWTMAQRSALWAFWHYIVFFLQGKTSPCFTEATQRTIRQNAIWDISANGYTRCSR